MVWVNSVNTCDASPWSHVSPLRMRLNWLPVSRYVAIGSMGLTSHSTHFRSFRSWWCDYGISQDYSRSQPHSVCATTVDREDTGGQSMPVRELNLIACPLVQSSCKTHFQTWIWTKAVESQASRHCCLFSGLAHWATEDRCRPNTIQLQLVVRHPASVGRYHRLCATVSWYRPTLHPAWYRTTVPRRTARWLRRHRLRSAAHGNFAVRLTRLRVSNKTFSAAGRGTWNALPADIKLTDSRICFTKKTQDTFF